MNYSGRHSLPGHPEKVTFNLRPKVSRAYQAKSEGAAFQVEGAACAKTGKQRRRRAHLRN